MNKQGTTGLKNDMFQRFHSKNESFTILFGGDTSLGKNYQEKMLAAFKLMMSSADFVLLNLQHADMDKAPQALLEHNVSLVSLANNATFEKTINVLRNHQIPMIGVGKNIAQAGTPFIGEIDFENKKFKFAIIAAFEMLPEYLNKYDVFANNDKLGFMPLDIEAIANRVQKIKKEYHDTFVILFVHWGDNYAWRNENQTKLSAQLINCGVNLIVGYGTHRIQEYEKRDDNCMVYGIGNFIVDKTERYDKLKALPYSYVLALNISPESNGFDVFLKLYPILSDNSITNYQPRFLQEAEFKEFLDVISDKMISAETVAYSRNIQQDQYGPYIQLPLIEADNKKIIEENNWIGMIYHESQRLVKDYTFPYLYRAHILENVLAKYQYKLICYTPLCVDKIQKMVTGFTLVNKGFRTIHMPIPQVNYDFSFGGDEYNTYERWALEHGYEIFPGRSFRKLAGDKLRTMEVLTEFDAAIVPRTELFTREASQLEAFLHKKNIVFLKPRYGNMGNDIIVIKVEDKRYIMEYYRSAKKKLNTFDTLQACVFYLNDRYTSKDYIVQEAIDVMRYDNSVFDVRVNLFNVGDKWQFTAEIRLGTKGSELSNISQGGKSEVASEFFYKLLPNDHNLNILEKIKKTTTDAASYLNERYDSMINEIAFDILIDKSENLYVAELNVKPGLPGPNRYSNFFQMTQEEKYIFEALTVKHGDYLAKSLLSRVHKPQQKYPYWFQDIKSDLVLETEDVNEVLSLIFNAIQKRLSSIKYLPSELQSDTQPRIVFISVSDQVFNAKVYIGSGKGLLGALNSALSDCANLTKTFNLQSVKLDIVQKTTTISDFHIDAPLEFDRSIYGLAFDDDIALAYLPQELVTHSIVTSEQYLLPSSIIEIASLNSVQKIAMLYRKYFLLYVFKLQSLYHSKKISTTLYRGHRIFNQVNPSLLLACAMSAGKYLQKIIKENGTFVYEYLPKIDQETEDYSLMRHAGTVYSMLELYKITQHEALLKNAKRALEYLLDEAKAIQQDNKDNLCIVEDDHISLGANALTLLSLSKYIALTDDKSYLDTARKFANWIKSIQNEQGEFFIHEQKFSTKENTTYISLYYPSEAIYSLVSLYQVDPDRVWLDMALNGVNYIIKMRDKNKNTSRLTHDHWLLCSLNELYRFKPDLLFIAHAKKICQAIISAQYRNPEPPDYAGSFYIPPQSLPVATRAEGLCAAYQLIKDNDDDKFADDILDAIILCLRFQLQMQYQPERTIYFKNAQRALGGFSSSLTDYSIRIDYVAHNLSSIIGLYNIFKKYQPVGKYEITQIEKDKFQRFEHRNNESFTLLFGGDTSLGENYQEMMLAAFKPMMSSADFVLLNLQHADVDKAPQALLEHNVSLVSLANNATFEKTINVLRNHQIPMIGVGENIAQAGIPFIGEVDFENKKFKFAIIAAFEMLPKYLNEYDVFANNDKSGFMPLDIEAIANRVQKIKKEYHDTFVILFVHWGDNYVWRNENQTKLSAQLINSGVNLIVGYGTHRIQEYEKRDDNCIVYGIGNFIVDKTEQYDKLKALPYSYVIALNVEPEGESFNVFLKLYPILSDNSITNYQPRFLQEAEFKEFLDVISDKMISAETVAYSRNIQQDQYGPYIQLPLIEADSKKIIEENNWIGMIFYDRKRKIAEYYFIPNLYRAIVIDRELAKYHYKLFCYPPENVDRANKTATGYILKDGKFTPINMSIPQINYDMHIGSPDGTAFRDYEKWALKRGYEIYPGKAFRRLASDKLHTTEVLAEFDKTIVPKTEIFAGEIAQLEKYFQGRRTVFLKPRYGNLGNSIIVIKKLGSSHYIMEYYLQAEKKSIIFEILSDCIDHINQYYGGIEYITQEAIDVIRYEDSVFDVRAILFSDENDTWHFISEIRLGAKKSEVSNIAQGGQSVVTEEFFHKLFPNDPNLIILDKIKQTTISAARFLNERYDGMVNEIAFDILMDTSKNLYIAELNVMPGLAGPKIHSFAEMTENEKYLFETLTVKHGKYLAKSLLSRIHKPQKKYPYWFQDIKSDLVLESENANKVLSLIFDAIEKRSPSIEGLPSELQSDTQPRIAFISVSDHVSKAKIYMGSGKGILRALNSALVRCANLDSTFDLQSIKLDIVQEVTTINNFNIEIPLEYERSLYGLAFDDDIALAYLPQELVIYSVVNENQYLHPTRILNVSPLTSAQKIAFLNREFFLLYVFKLQSFYHSKIISISLYRGHRIFNEIDPSLLLTSAILAGKYLQNNLKENGAFVYEYLPKIDQEAKGYSLARHAGTVYSMLELYEITQHEALLKNAKRALEYLLNEIKTIQRDNESISCIVEDDLASLGANALALLALSKYMSLTDDKSYLATARKLGCWIKLTQNEQGEFFIHEQKFSTKENTDYISPYYPSEAIFSLIRLYQIDSDPVWLNLGLNGVDYIIDVRDKDKNISQLNHDYWLLCALKELNHLRSDVKYITHTQKICQAIMSAQYRKSEPEDYIGSFYNPPSSTPVASRSEGLCAAYWLMSNNGYAQESVDILTTIKLCVQFQLQTQFQLERTYYLINPQRAIGGFSYSLTNYGIRIDYVQHNLSSLIGLYKILTQPNLI